MQSAMPSRGDRITQALSPFKRRPRPLSQSFWQQALKVAIDKDQRATVLWWSSGFALFLLTGYYLWLGFTPAFSIGQSPLLLLGAFIVGFGTTVYLANALFFPAWCYRYLNISIEQFEGDQQRDAIKFLTLRSIAAQSAALSFVFLMAGGAPWTLDPISLLYEGGALLVLALGVTVLIRQRRLTKLVRAETQAEYWGSVAGLAISGLVSAVILYMVYTVPASKERAPAWVFLFSMGMIVMVSAAISTQRRSERWLRIVIGTFVYCMVLALTNNATLPFRSIAGALGIAVPGFVEVIVPPATCPLLRMALADASGLRCDTDGGRLAHVRLMNTVGDRWVLREAATSENIVFDGRGSAYRPSRVSKPPER